MTGIVLKIGGSLAKTDELPELCRIIGKLGARRSLLIVPGGGLFADSVRDCSRRYPLSDETAHWMAVTGMNQFGMMLADLIPGSRAVSSPDEDMDNDMEGPVVLLPHALLRELDPLPKSWTVTSDSIAAWVADYIRASMLVLLKDVDGLCNADPKHNPAADPLPVVSQEALYGCRGVDSHFPILFRNTKMNCWVINGRQPERITELLETGTTLGTRLIRES